MGWKRIEEVIPANQRQLINNDADDEYLEQIAAGFDETFSRR